MAAPPPSGEQHLIEAGATRAAVTEVGATLRGLWVDGLALLDGFEAGEICDGGRGQPLIPWPNRLRGGRYEHAGVGHQLPLDELPAGNAIHGLVRWRPWSAEAAAPGSLTMRLHLHPQPGYPFDLELAIRYTVSVGALGVRASARNLGDAPAPYGCGFHPYLAPGGALERATLVLPAATALIVDERGIPTDREPAAGELDLRSPRPLGGRRLDHCLTDLERGAGGRASAVLLRADGRRLTLWLDRAFGFVMVFTGDTLRPERRRRGVAVEPMTCAPNALASGDGLALIEPGAELAASWGLALEAGR